MLEQLKKLVGSKLDKYELWIDSVTKEKEGNNTYLRIVLDSEKTLDLSTVTMTTRILNPIIDKVNFIEEEYILDVYAKPKGEDKNEQ